MSSPSPSPIKTPVFRVEELYPPLSGVDYNSESFWTLHKAALERNIDERSKYRRRVLDFGSSTAASKAFKKKMRAKMKWYPADRARAAQNLIRNLDINPGRGYKIKIVKDDSVSPPSMPPTPAPSPMESLNSVLMKGAQDRARKKEIAGLTTEDIAKRKEKEIVEQKKPADELEQKAERKREEKQHSIKARKKEDIKEDIDSKPCPGCDKADCINKEKLQYAVDMAESISGFDYIASMPPASRESWFVNMYKNKYPCLTGIDCAKRFASSTQKISGLFDVKTSPGGLSEDTDDLSTLSPCSSYVSSTLKAQVREEEYLLYLQNCSLQQEASALSRKQELVPKAVKTTVPCTGKKKNSTSSAGKKKKSTSAEKKKKSTSAEKKRNRKPLFTQSCPGCGLITCLYKDGLGLAVATANSMKMEQYIAEMSPEERMDWFIELYKDIDPVHCKYGMKCAVRYARRNMGYLTAFYQLKLDCLRRKELGLEKEEGDAESNGSSKKHGRKNEFC